MTKEQYLKQRAELYAKAKTELEAGNIDASNQLMNDIEKLDETYEKSAKAQANLNALENRTVVSSDASVSAASLSIAGSQIIVDPIANSTPVNYETVFAKIYLDKELTAQEKVEFSRINNADYTNDTKKQEVLVPTTVISGIIGMVKQTYPFFGEIPLLNIRGKVTAKKHTEIVQGDAGFVDEGTPKEGEENKFEEITLSGFELVKNITISFKLEAMSIEEFIPFITSELTERIGYALGVNALQGKGTKEPKGAIEELTGTDQSIETAKAGEIGYKDITKLRSLIKSQFAPFIKYYANSETIWNQLANILDENGNPIFIKDTTANGVGNIFGVMVVEDDGVPTDEVLLGAPSQGMFGNINKPLSIEYQRMLKDREAVYQGYMIIDWTMKYLQAFAHLKVKQGTK